VLVIRIVGLSQQAVHAETVCSRASFLGAMEAVHEVLKEKRTNKSGDARIEAERKRARGNQMAQIEEDRVCFPTSATVPSLP
jgi:hypothetical protein